MPVHKYTKKPGIHEVALSGLRIIVFFGNLQLFYNLTMDMLLKGTSCKTSFYGAVALIIASMLVFCSGLDARDRSANALGR